MNLPPTGEAGESPIPRLASNRDGEQYGTGR